MLAAPPHAVFSTQNVLAVDFLPPFYRSLLLAWRACKGSFQTSTLGIGSGIEFCPVSSMTTRSAYLFLLSENAVVPHCETKFFPLFGSLYWSWTWRQRPSAVDVMERVKSRVRFYLPLFFHRFHSSRRRRFFVRQWGARGVVASVQNDVLVVHL